MKKTVCLPILVLAVVASQAWAVDCTRDDQVLFCEWDGPSCHSINNTYDPNKGKTCEALIAGCEADGTLYIGVTVTGEGKYCSTTGEKIGGADKCEDRYCKWESNGTCNQIKSNDKIGAQQTPATSCEEAIENCHDNGFLFDDATCEHQINEKSQTAVSVGCCKWNNPETNPTGGCWNIMDDDPDAEDKVADCKTGTNVFFAGACPNTQGSCPASSSSVAGASSSSVAGASSSSVAAGTSSSSVAAGTSSSSTVAGTSSSSGAIGASSSSVSDTDSFEYCIIDGTCHKGPYLVSMCITTLKGIPANDCGTTPIILSRLAQSNMLSAMQNAVNLQTAGNATVQVFDLKGNAILTRKFSQGSYVMPLALPRGLYIVKADNASWKQTIKVTVK